MTRHCFFMNVNAGFEEEYKRRHDEIWTELTDAIKSAGIRNYSIFRKAEMLIGYFESDNFDFSVKTLNASPIMQKWGLYMADIMGAEIDPKTNFPVQATLIWTLDETLTSE